VLPQDRQGQPTPQAGRRLLRAHILTRGPAARPRGGVGSKPPAMRRERGSFQASQIQSSNTAAYCALTIALAASLYRDFERT
jgi:hypothetical protein